MRYNESEEGSPALRQAGARSHGTGVRTRMELDQLRLFADLVRTGSFTKVAEINYIPQPAVSSRIRKLEEELGTRLVERTTRKVIVTEDGRIFYDYAKEILRQ